MHRVASLFGLLLACSAARGADLAQIRDELREVQTSIASIRLEYAKTASNGFRVDCVYLQSGPAMRFINTTPDFTISESFDGQFGYSAQWNPKDAPPGKYAYPSMIEKSTEVSSGLLGEMTPMDWFGMPVSPMGKALWELLENATIVGESTHEGLAVIELDLGEHPDRLGGRRHVRCKLAMQRGYVPVDIVVTPEEGTASEFPVESLRKVPHPLLGRTIWFPERMTFRANTPLETTIELSSVSLNPHIPTDEFVPQPETGTLVRDHTARPERQSYIHGEAEARQQIIAQVDEVLPPLNSGIKAQPDEVSLRWWHWLLFAAISFAVAGWLWRTRS